jgi:DNA-binding phage protein
MRGAEHPNKEKSLTCTLQLNLDYNNSIAITFNLAKEQGLESVALYKALGENGNPTLTTLLAIFKALGIKMSVAA